MKSVSITTIICGTALIIAPLVHNIMTMHMVVSLMQQGHAHVDLAGELSSAYTSWCMFIGVCVIVSGLVVGLRSRNTSGEQPTVIRTSHAAPSNA